MDAAFVTLVQMTTDFMRHSTGMAPLDHVLGGGLVGAAAILLAGPPGIGRTTLALQILAGLGHRCLFASGEETREHLEGTARRIGALTPRLSVLSERNLSTIFTHAREVRAQTLVVDTIQRVMCDDVSGRAGSPTQLKECLARLIDYAKTTGTTVWIIGHVTSNDNVAGPKMIQHSVDVVLELSRGARFDGTERILRCPYNRFGPTDAIGHFALTAQGFVPVDADERPNADRTSVQAAKSSERSAVMNKLDKHKARDATVAFDAGQISALAVAGYLPAALDRVDELEAAVLLCADAAMEGLASSSVSQKSTALADVHGCLRAVLEEGGVQPWMQTSRHQARLASWSADDLKARLVALVDEISAEKGKGASPIDVALQLLGGELEAFVLFGRVGHLDPPRSDGKVPIAILRRRSEDPVIDQKIRETARQWATDDGAKD